MFHLRHIRSAPALLLAAVLLCAGVPAHAQFKPAAEQSVPVREDTDWHWWWHYNKDQYLRLRERIFERQPSTGSQDFMLGIGEKIVEKDPTEISAWELRGRIVPALLAAMEENPLEQPNPTLIASSMIALAKIGPRGELADGDPFDAIFEDYLDHDVLSLREQAVIALGIFGRTDSVPTLGHLLEDTPEAHRLTDMTEITPNMRSFAAYSLGLIGAQTDDMGMRRTIVEILRRTIDGPRFPRRDMKVACISAMGIVPIEPTKEWTEPRRRRPGERRPPPPDPTESREEQLRYLLSVLKAKRTHHDLIRSHVPTAMARLLPGADPRMKEEVLPEVLKLVKKFTEERQEVQQSATLALGEIADADDSGLDREAHKTLFRLVEKADQNSRRYAVISLGKVAARRGTSDEPFGAQPGIIKFLRRQMGTFGESRVKPWTALALGVMTRSLAEQRLTTPPEVGEVMLKALEDCRTPLDIGGFSLALGLARNLDGLEVLIEKLEVFAEDEPLGNLYLSMGLVNDISATETVLEGLEEARLRAERMELISISLALLGRTERVPILFEMLQEAGSQESQGPVVAALGVTGDRRVILPLVEVLEDDEAYTEDVRATAAFGLGIVADKEKLSWRSRYSAGVNYTSAPPTLRGGGILDFL